MNNSTTQDDLERFLEAQTATYPRALVEVRNGHKTTHWMWYIFPQIRGLGRSTMAQRYAIQDLDEAKAYLGHPVLGPRLLEITRALLDEPRTLSAEEIFGWIDARKLRSCWTLFSVAADATANVFEQGLDRYFDGEMDPDTLAKLDQGRR